MNIVNVLISTPIIVLFPIACKLSYFVPYITTCLLPMIHGSSQTSLKAQHCTQVRINIRAPQTIINAALYISASSNLSMNSYPVELLVQHAPLMFVAGLEDIAASGQPIPVNGDALASPAQERRASVNQDSRDSFSVLTSRLRNSFASRRRGAVWDLNKSNHFSVILVDKVII